MENDNLPEKSDREIFHKVIDKAVIEKSMSQVKNPYLVAFIFKTGLQLDMRIISEIYERI